LEAFLEQEGPLGKYNTRRLGGELRNLRRQNGLMPHAQAAELYEIAVHRIIRRQVMEGVGGYNTQKGRPQSFDMAQNLVIALTQVATVKEVFEQQTGPPLQLGQVVSAEVSWSI